jgi:adenosylcobinamide-phosphate synthase
MDAVAIALLIDAIVGDPRGVWARTGHPVTWFGGVIDRLEQVLNTGQGRQTRGVVALGLAVAAFAVPVWLAAPVLEAVPLGWLLEAAIASALIAHKSLQDHVAAVANAPTLKAARGSVAMIVGRDTARMDEAGVSRAGIETLAESLSDGVVAPAFWFALAGLPGIVVYKVVNTADSMIGHRTARHESFGWAAARLDDVMNYIPARITAFLLKLAAPAAFGHNEAIRRDALGHLSPNAGWPETVMAYGLGVALGGPRTYAGRKVDGVWLNRSGREATRADLDKALVVSARFGAIHYLVYAVLALF